MSKFDKSKYNETFTAEANEQLTEMNRLLLILEKDIENIEALNDFFRQVHTLKGTSAILGHGQISEISHLMEDILDKLRNKEVAFGPSEIDVLFESVDTLEALVGDVGKDTGDTDGNKMIAKLKGLSGSNDVKELEKDITGEYVMPVTEFISTMSKKEREKAESEIKDGVAVYLISIEFDRKCKFIEGRAFQTLRDLGEVGSVIKTIPDVKDLEKIMEEGFHILLATDKRQEEVDDIIYQTPEVANVVFEAVTSFSMGGEDQEKSSKSMGIGDTIRVNVHLLDALLNLVGEKMINNIQINQIASDMKNKDLMNTLKTSNRLTEELQHYVLQMRMVPIDHIFRRFPRMVRDMAKEEGKDINFIIEGRDIEIDRGLLDEIGDSLLHLLRNAVDHGIESKEDRKKGGKDPTGSINLTAHREQSYVVIDIYDDGNGINVDKLTEAAVRKGIVQEKDAIEMSPQERLGLIFLPGVSTAEKVTEVSGRGVGLDVVYNKITSLGGSVSIDSDITQGTKVTIKLPPTMAIIKALLVQVAEERYALPLENVAETVKISAAEIHTINRTGIFKLRDEVIPLFDLNREFTGTDTPNDGSLSAVIVEKDNVKVGLIVDRFIEQQEIVVKTLAKQLRKSRYFSGATILGDGSVAMIIDVGAFT